MFGRISSSQNIFLLQCDLIRLKKKNEDENCLLFIFSQVCQPRLLCQPKFSYFAHCSELNVALQFLFECLMPVETEKILISIPSNIKRRFYFT